MTTHTSSRELDEMCNLFRSQHRIMYNSSESYYQEYYLDPFLEAVNAYIDGGPGPTEAEIERMISLVKEAHPEAVASGSFEVYWEPRLRELAKNPGFLLFALREALHSDGGLACAVMLHTGDPKLFEIAFEKCLYSLLATPERWQEDIRADDKLLFWASTSPIFQEIRVRTQKAAEVIDAVRSSRVKEGRRLNILIVGAGRLSELRFSGFIFDPEEIRVFAMDKRLQDLEKVLRDQSPASCRVRIQGKVMPVSEYLYDGGTLEGLGLYPIEADIKSWLEHDHQHVPEDKKVALPPIFDVIVMNGVAIYIFQHLLGVLRGLAKRLAPGGQLFWDWSFPGHDSLRFWLLCFGWGIADGNPRNVANRERLQKARKKLDLAPGTPGLMKAFVFLAKLFPAMWRVKIRMETENCVSPSNAVYFTFKRSQ